MNLTIRILVACCSLQLLRLPEPQRDDDDDDDDDTLTS
jgi:hypothetical protein